MAGTKNFFFGGKKVMLKGKEAASSTPRN